MNVLRALHSRVIFSYDMAASDPSAASHLKWEGAGCPRNMKERGVKHERQAPFLKQSS